jgi:hypothetical protein
MSRLIQERVPIIGIEDRAIEFFTCPICLAFYVYVKFILDIYRNKEFSFDALLSLIKNNFDNISFEDESIIHCLENVFEFMKK